MAKPKKDEEPDALIIETFMDVVMGKATEADLLTALDLCLSLLDWTGFEEKKYLNQHLLDCANCRRRTIGSARVDYMVQRIFPGARVVDITDEIQAALGKPSDLAHTPPVKGVH